jgi:hypothetical protein
MTMSNREHLICLAALTALVTFSGVARADDYSIPNTDRFERPEAQSQPVTCAQAQAFAWFKHQMALSDGDVDLDDAAPIECERTRLAAKSDVDPGTYEESK